MLFSFRTSRFIRCGWGWPLGAGLLLTAPAAAQAPVLTALVPARNALAAPRAATVAATFSVPLGAGATAGIRVFSNQAGGLKAGIATVSGNTLTFNPTRDFRPGETVRTTFTTAVRGAGGAGGTALVRPVVAQFTTAAGVGPATFLGGPVLATGAAAGIATGDIDGDGDDDILAVGSVGGAPTLVAQRNDGAGGFSAGPTMPLGPMTNSGAITLGDVDGDGDLDAVIAQSIGVVVATNAGTGVFSAGPVLPISPGPYQLVLADMDGDGDLDLLTASYNVVAVRLNNGVGQFTGTLNLSSGPTCFSLAVGDVDGDGDLDLVNSTFTNNNFVVGHARVRLNLGNGTFATTFTTLDTTPLPGHTALTDIDGDGDLDVLVGSYNAGQVTVQRNGGAGTFTPDSATVPLGVSALGAVADLDGDGDQDLLGYDSFGSQLSVVRNDGTGHFGTPRLAPLGNTPYMVAVADFDGDNALDVVAPHQNAGGLQVLFNRVAPPVVTGFAPTSGPVGTVVTLTGTGLREIRRVSVNNVVARVFTAASSTSLTLTVPPGATTGKLRVSTPGGTAVSGASFTVTGPAPPVVTARSPARHAPAAPRAGAVGLTFSQAMAAASAGNVRVFGDQRRGQRTLTATGGGTTRLSLQPALPFAPGERVRVSVPATMLNPAGVGVRAQVHEFTAASGPSLVQFTHLPNVALGGTPLGSAAADIDNDGDLDLLSVAYDRGLYVRRNNGTGTCTGTTRLAGGSGYAVLAADVDGDGDLDALIANSAGLVVGRNDGTGTFALLPLVRAANAYCFGLAVADLDADGDLDVVLPNYFSNSVSVRFNDGAGTFSGYADELVGAQPVDIATGDLDNDGDIDFVTANTGAGTVSVRLNDGVGGFLTGPEIIVGAACAAVALGDIDGDGKLDLAARFRYQFDTVSVFRGTGTGQFTARTDRVMGRYLYNLAFADMNGDGAPDLVTSIVGAGIVWLNDGAGLFAPAPGTPTGIPDPFAIVGPVSHIAAADMNGDGALDLVVTPLDYVGPALFVQLNQVPVGVAPPAADSAPALSLWPNPAHGAVQVRVPAGAATVVVLDGPGRVVRTLAFDASSAPTTRLLPLAGLPAGVYVVRCGALARRLVVE